ncbi:MAG: transposase, partial [Bryobacteraceae bacterium]
MSAWRPIWRARPCAARPSVDREQPLKDYCRGLLVPGERKSVEPMAARLHPER